MLLINNEFNSAGVYQFRRVLRFSFINFFRNGGSKPPPYIIRVAEDVDPYRFCLLSLIYHLLSIISYLIFASTLHHTGRRGRRPLPILSIISYLIFPPPYVPHFSSTPPPVPPPAGEAYHRNAVI